MSSIVFLIRAEIKSTRIFGTKYVSQRIKDVNISDSKIANIFYALRRNGSKLLKRLLKTSNDENVEARVFVLIFRNILG